MNYICTKFGADSSSRFPFTARTNTHRDTQSHVYATDHPTHSSATAGVPSSRQCSQRQVEDLIALVIQAL